MSDNINDLEKNFQLPEAAFDKYRYNSATIEVNLKAWELYEDTEFLKSLRDYGYNYLYPAKDYPYRCIVAVDRAIAARCLPDKSESEAGLEMGRRFFDGLSLSVIGRIMKAPLKVMNIERGLSAMVNNFNQNAGFGNRELIKVGLNHYQVVSSDDAAATEVITRYIWLGIYERLLEQFGATNIKGEVSVLGPFSFKVDVQWE